MQAKKNRGSALLLVLIALLILSLIGLAALTQSGSEINTTGNFYKDKSTFYTADAGIQNGINQIDLQSSDPTQVKFSGTIGKNTYFTGVSTPTTPQNVTGFQGFLPPPIVGQSTEMNNELNMKNASWQLTITAVSNTGTKNQTRKQVQAVIITMVPIGN
jgi:Tfp pilus assembly protein PilX